MDFFVNNSDKHDDEEMQTKVNHVEGIFSQKCGRLIIFNEMWCKKDNTVYSQRQGKKTHAGLLAEMHTKKKKYVWVILHPKIKRKKKKIVKKLKLTW